jgi:hypothetical protein
MTNQPHPTQKLDLSKQKSQQKSKHDKLAEQLRANLRRRKAPESEE